MNEKDRYKVVNCEMGVMDLSDHSPLYLTIRLECEKKTMIWRLNSSMLKGQMREEIVMGLKTHMKENDNREVSSLVLWDACKTVMRGQLIAK